ncbi:hypothetical protein GCM10009676_45690 [Prauserella halophila]|uniref:Uncharacterized protein n=1 Tax=Prauserella halophila TaxID=185641 RepID=A0ABN1WL96_9PSEU|nr:hypothetical protein [Prauserella halophila]MCP2237572.1 hypothetical protein [Prauserella halophila]
MDKVLGQVLRNAVWERLDMLSDLAGRADEPSLVSVARSELPRLTDGWRAMLLSHEPDDGGHCPTCSTRWRRVKAPCTVWQVAHEHLVAGGLAPEQPTKRKLRRKVPAPASATHTPETSPRRSDEPALPEQTGRHALVAPTSARHVATGTPTR